MCYKMESLLLKWVMTALPSQQSQLLGWLQINLVATVTETTAGSWWVYT